MKGDNCVPTAGAYSRFIENVIKHLDLLEDMFANLRQKCYAIFPEFGKYLAIDGKAVPSYAQSSGDKKKKDGTNDLRGDSDADWGNHGHFNKLKEKVKVWFGYTIHLIADTQYELPVYFKVTKASESEVRNAHRMIDEISDNNPKILEKREYFTADRGYDDGKLIEKLEDNGSSHVIDIRNCWHTLPETTIPLKTGRRIFTSVPRDSMKWEKLYDMRSAIERVNSRLDNMFGFERHTIRGLKKMTFRVTLAYFLMLVFAVAMAETGRPDKIRSFLTAA